MVKNNYPKDAEKARIESIFKTKFPDKRLLAIQLDGFSHRVIYDDVPKTPKAHAISVSFCMGPIEELEYAKAAGKDLRSQRLAREFLSEAGYGSHFHYQNNPVEVIFVNPKDR